MQYLLRSEVWKLNPEEVIRHAQKYCPLWYSSQYYCEQINKQPEWSTIEDWSMHMRNFHIVTETVYKQFIWYDPMYVFMYFLKRDTAKYWQ